MSDSIATCDICGRPALIVSDNAPILCGRCTISRKNDGAIFVGFSNPNVIYADDEKCQQTGKVRYLSYNGAKQVIGTFKHGRRRGEVRRGEAGLGVYRCAHCRHWHIGNTAKWSPKSKQGRRRPVVES